MKRQNILVRNKEKLEEKIKAIKSDGINKLHIVSDFDRTLTKYFYNDKKSCSSYILIQEGGHLKNDYPEKSRLLFDKYYPIEIDNSLDYVFKFNKMIEWWELQKKLMIESNLHKEVIINTAKNHPDLLRNGIDIFLDNLNKYNIPLLIFSAGIGNLIEESIKNINKLTPNIHILSNTFEFDENGFAIGYKNEIIHIMNKSEDKIRDAEYKKLITKRDNVILLGDSLDDLAMVNETKVNVLIKIGFLNDNIQDNLEQYSNKFDIVITNDGSMNYVNQILEKICK